VIREKEYNFFATCAKGVEEVLVGELRALGLRGIKPGTGGVHFAGNMTECYKANVWLRTATRVLLELSHFKAAGNEELYNGARAIPWGDYFRLNQTFAVFASVRDSKITHSGFTALKVKDAVADSFKAMYGSRPNVDSSDPDVRIFVRIFKDECTVNIDTSGESLHKRGYRTGGHEAPLRETLAAAILLMAGYDGSRDLCDFMCGSGTIPIEAALIALNIAPGLKRKSFGFQRLLTFNKRAWAKVTGEAESKKRHRPAHNIYASDISKKNIEIVKSNARKAGVRQFIDISVSDFKHTVRQNDSGIIVSNPPYGERLNAGENEKLEDMFKTLGDTLKKNYTGYDAYILCGNLDLIKNVGLKTEKKTVLFNGKIECRLLEYKLYEGTAGG
jgi:putative N6-adenine-specific DNA methylase